MAEEKSDHDLLMDVHRAMFGRLGMIKQFENHLAHHWVIDSGLVLIALGAIVTAIWKG